MYLDLSAAGPDPGINQGDFQAAFQAAFDTVNEAGGVNGRMLEPVYTPIVPASADQGTAACTSSTEDESVFVVLGNYVDENAPCIVTTHETPLLGGDLAMNAETLAAAKALWYAVGGGADSAGCGHADTRRPGSARRQRRGRRRARFRVAVRGQCSKPILEAGGVNVVDVAYLDIISGAGDPNALFAAAETIALKFESEGIDQIIFNTDAGQVFPNGLARTDYRPAAVVRQRWRTRSCTTTARAAISRCWRMPSRIGPYDSREPLPRDGRSDRGVHRVAGGEARYHHPSHRRGARR